MTSQDRWFLNESRKTKTKVITLFQSQTTQIVNPMNQSNSKPLHTASVKRRKSTCASESRFCFDFTCLPARATFVVDTNFVSGTQKNVSDIGQKHFVSATNVSQFCAAWKHNIYFVSRAFTRPRNIISDGSATMCPQQCVLVCQGFSGGNGNVISLDTQ